MNQTSLQPGSGVVIERRVEWPDTDAAGHHHHSTILRWVEAAEAEFYDSIGLIDLFGVIPRVRVEVNHRARLWFRDVVRIKLWVERVGTTSLTFRFEIDRDGTGAADGSMTVVHLDPDAGRGRAWPASVRAALAPAR